MSKRLKPTELELLMLKVLWDADSAGELPLAVRDVRARLERIGRPLAHTSVITTLNIMVDKRLLRRRKRKNAMYYWPLVAADDVRKSELSDMLARLFDGSPQQLMSALLDSRSRRDHHCRNTTIDQCKSKRIGRQLSGPLKKVAERREPSGCVGIQTARAVRLRWHPHGEVPGGLCRSASISTCAHIFQHSAWIA